jgi:GNAT superfamily N-acetyltransferase
MVLLEIKSMQDSPLTFEPISLFARGELAEIIAKSYAELVEKWPDPWEREREKWEDYDRQAFDHPDTVGRCIFVSCLERKPVGSASYDPRPGPSYAIVGQNCVLPEYRCRGFGRRQILEILGRFKAQEIRRARVTTSEHPFFLPAVRMYRDLGFQEIRRLTGGPDPRYQLVELEKRLLT